jgi:hypothetical protein
MAGKVRVSNSVSTGRVRVSVFLMVVGTTTVVGSAVIVVGIVTVVTAVSVTGFPGIVMVRVRVCSRPYRVRVTVRVWV